MILSVNPNRMELLRLKKKLLYAQKGHDLLEDKLQEMMRRFNELFKNTLALQEDIEKEIESASKNIISTRILNKKRELLGYLEGVKLDVSIKIDTQVIMGVKIPSLNLEICNCRYPNTKIFLDLELGLDKWIRIMVKLTKLAQQLKTCQLLAQEIESVRRRVNALEYILIPSIKQTIHYIEERLNEFERASLLRLVRIKEIILKR